MRYFTLTIIPFILTASLLGACHTPEEDSGSAAHLTTEAEHRERIKEAWQHYEAAQLDGDADRAVEIFSEDVTIRGSSTIHGRSVYRDRIVRFLSTASLEYLKGEVEDVIVMGDHVFAAGTWSEQFQRENADEPVSLRGGFAWLLRLEEDDEWRISQFIWTRHPDPEN